MSTDSIQILAAAILKLKDGEELDAALIARITELAAVAARTPPAAPVPAVVPDAPVKPRKAKAAAAGAGADDESRYFIPVGDDPYRTCKYRLQMADVRLCMGRKIDDKNPVPGTRTTDAGSNGRYFPEKQCSKKPFPGTSLCEKCAEKERAFISNTTGKQIAQYYGRLDQPMYKDAKVIGCETFLAAYKSGIPEVPIVGAAAPAPAAAEATKPRGRPKKELLTAAPAEAAAVAAPAPAVTNELVVAPAAPEAKKRGRPAKAAVAEPTAPAAAGAGAAAPPPAVEKKVVRKIKKATTTVAADEPVADLEWVTFMFNGLPHARHSKTGNVYPFDALTNQPEREKYVGKWRNGAVDEYAPEDDE